jgi:hypothetical protein
MERAIIEVSSPFSFDAAIAAAHNSIEACVVIGGALLFEKASFNALRSAVERGVAVRLLFPSPRSQWLHSLVTEVRGDIAAYAKHVVEAAQLAAAGLPTAAVRWYEAPGPCWFTLVDRSVLFTKPFDMARPTIPAPESREAHIEHFGLLFDQLWERSRDSFQTRPIETAAPIVQVIGISAEIIARLAAQPEDLSLLSPDAFELLVADRLAAMGLGVQRIGSINSRDGGIDIIAWPEKNAAIPYLLAVQAKHSRKGITVPSRVVRDLKGVLSVAPFDVGLLVTNTSFSPDARWFAREKPNIIRLRDFADLARWLRADFAHEVLERDLPSEISLGPGLRIPIRSSGQRS